MSTGTKHDTMEHDSINSSSWSNVCLLRTTYTHTTVCDRRQSILQRGPGPNVLQDRLNWLNYACGVTIKYSDTNISLTYLVSLVNDCLFSYNVRHRLVWLPCSRYT